MVLSEQIIQVLEFLCEKWGIAVDWTAENIIPYLQTISQKIIIYSITTDVFWTIFGLIMCVVAGIWLKYSIKHWDEWEDNLIVVSGIILGSLIMIFGIGVTFTNIYELCTCLAFPELRIIEFINRYIN